MVFIERLAKVSIFLTNNMRVDGKVTHVRTRVAKLETNKSS